MTDGMKDGSGTRGFSVEGISLLLCGTRDRIAKGRQQYEGNNNPQEKEVLVPSIWKRLGLLLTLVIML